MGETEARYLRESQFLWLGAQHMSRELIFMTALEIPALVRLRTTRRANIGLDKSRKTMLGSLEEKVNTGLEGAE